MTGPIEIEIINILTLLCISFYNLQDLYGVQNNILCITS